MTSTTTHPSRTEPTADAQTSPGPGAAGTPVGPWTRRVFLLGVLAQVGIVVTGGLVRLTGSGLGCPSWPQCVPGSFTPVFHQAQGYHKYIEFTNRTLTFVVSAAIAACLIAAWLHRPRRRTLLLLAGAQILGVVAQAVLGGITVLTHLNPAAVAAHFLLSMVLIAAAVALYERSGEGDGPARPLVRAEIRWTAWALVAVSAAVVAAGTVVTGSGPHAGDEHAVRFGVDPREATALHTDLVWLYVGLAIGLAVMLRLTGAPRRARQRARDVLIVVAVQAGIGYYQYFNGLPIAAVALHMLGACLVIVSAVRVLYTLRERPSAVPLGEPVIPAAPEPSSES